MKILSLITVTLLTALHTGLISAGTLCKTRDNPKIENKYIHELGGLKSIGWDRSTEKAKAKFVLVRDSNGSIIPGEQEITGKTLSTTNQDNGNISISFPMPSGEKYLLRAFHASSDKVMYAYGALIQETSEGPQLSLSYGQEFFDCISLDL